MSKKKSKKSKEAEKSQKTGEEKLRRGKIDKEEILKALWEKEQEGLPPLSGLKPVDLKSEIQQIDILGLRRWLLLKLIDAYREAKVGKGKTSDENAFELHWLENIIKLRDAIMERRYEPGRSMSFVVFDPMVREIFAAPFKDRVVHHFLYDMQAGWWDRRFIKHSYSCRVGKGTQRAVLACQHHMRQVTKNGTRPARCVKLDVQGYFMSLSREKLYARMEWGINQQFKEFENDQMGWQLREICKYLWFKILMDDAAEGSRKRGPLRYWDPEILPSSKSLYCQPPGYGIVIGNLTSQLVSNVYLDLLDRYVTIDLKYKYYARYVDDFYIMVPEEEWPRLSADIPRIEKFMKEKMDVTLHPRKRSVQSVYKGVNFVGSRVHLHCCYPSNRIQSHFPKALEHFLKTGSETDRAK